MFGSWNLEGRYRCSLFFVFDSFDEIAIRSFPFRCLRFRSPAYRISKERFCLFVYFIFFLFR